MSDLIQIQQTFQRYVLDGEPGIVECIAGGEGVDPVQRLRIYYDAYRLRLIEALATDYEALQALLGVDEFNAAARAYVEGTPSLYRNVRWYGAGLPQFLRVTPPWAEQPLAHELALFEWTLTLAFDAPDRPVVCFEDLARLPAEQWPALGFVLHPSVHPIELRTNAPAFRKAHDAGEPPPQISGADGATPWLVWRKDFTVSFRSLGEPEAWALRAVQNSADFTALCEGLCDWFAPDQAAPHAAQLLRQWVDDALISELAMSDECA